MARPGKNDIEVSFSARDNLSRELNVLESKIIRFVGAVSSAVTAVGLIAFPIKAAAQFQEELLNTQRTTGFTTTQIGELQKGLVSLSKQLGTSARDLAKISTMGGQLGIGDGGDIQELLAFTKEISAASVALDVSVEEAGASFGKLITIFDLSPATFSKAISALVEVGLASNATSQELFDITRRIGNLGGSVDFPEAVALAGALIDLGQTAETAGTSLSKIFSDMKADAADFAAFIADPKLTAGAFADLVASDGIAALNLYLNRLNEVGATEAAVTKIQLTGGGRLFEVVTKLQAQQKRAADFKKRQAEVEAQILELQQDSANLNLASIETLQAQANAYGESARNADLVAKLSDKARKGFDEGTAAAEAQALVLQGLNRQIDRAAAAFGSLSIGAGEAALPAITDLFKLLADAIGDPETIREFGEGVRDVVDILVTLGNVYQDLTSSFSDGINLDIGSLVRIGAIIGATVALKGLSSVFKLISASFLELIPGGQKLSVSLGLVEKSAVGAGGAADKAATGWAKLREVYTAARASSVGFQTAQDKLHQLAQRDPKLAAAAVNGVYSMQAARNALARTNASLASVEEKLATAINKRSIAGLNSAKKQLLAQQKVQQDAIRLMSFDLGGLIVGGFKTAFGDLIASWAAAETRLMQGTLLLRGAFRGLTLAARGFALVLGTISKILVFGFIAKEVLQLTGLLQPLLRIIEKVFAAFGAEPPNWLKSEDTKLAATKEATEQLRRQDAVMDQLTSRAADFNAETKSIVETYKDLSLATKNLTYNVEEPTAAARNFNEALVQSGNFMARAKLNTVQLERAQARLKIAQEAVTNATNEAGRARATKDVGTITAQIKQLQEEALNVEDAKKALTNTVMLGLNPTQARGLFSPLEKGAESLAMQLVDANQKLIDLGEARDAVTEAINTARTSASFAVEAGENYAKSFQGLEDARLEQARLNEEYAKAEVVLARLERSSDSTLGSLSEGIKQLAKNGPAALTALNNGLAHLSKGADRFSGLAQPLVEENDIRALGATVVATQRLVGLYRDFKNEADAAGKAAESAVKTALANTTAFIAETARALDELAARRKNAQQEAKREKFGEKQADANLLEERRIRDKAAQDIIEIEERRAARQASLDTLTGARGKQRALEYRQDTQKEIDAINDRADKAVLALEKATERRLQAMQVKDATANMEAEFTAISELEKEITKLNNIISTTPDDAARADAFTKQEQSLAKLKERVEGLTPALREVDTLRVDGAFALSAEEAENLQKRINEVQLSFAALNQSSAGLLQGFYTSRSNEFAKAAANLEQQGLVAAQRFADRAKQEYGSVREAVEAYADAIVAEGGEDKLRQKLDALRSSSVLDPGNLSDYQAALADIVNTLSEMGSQTAITEKKTASLTEEQKKQSKALASRLSQLITAPDLPPPPDVSVTGNIDNLVLDPNLEPPVVPLRGEVVSIDAVQKATGGLIGRSKADYRPGTTTIGVRGSTGGFFGGLPRYARGSQGKVSGSGTGTSDSVLAWLSNGEYVMDALTVSRFGAGFFKMIQDMARGGVSQSILGNLSLPAFATGGPVGLESVLGSFENDFKTAGGDVTHLDITMNQKKVGRVSGDRDSISGLVRVLKDIERSSN